MVHQWVTKGSIDNARRPGRGSMMRPTINKESDCLRKKNLRRRRHTDNMDEKKILLVSIDIEGTRLGEFRNRDIVFITACASVWKI
jgi:hypothetical protein